MFASLHYHADHVFLLKQQAGYNFAIYTMVNLLPTKQNLVSPGLYTNIYVPACVRKFKR